MKQIKYKEKKAKYILAEDYTENTGILGYQIDTQFIKLTLVGVLTLRTGYPSDGPSGPTVDSKSSIRGAYEHDAFYELMRNGFIPLSEKDNIDQRLENVCLEDGMNPIRAELWRKGVDLFGSGSADPKNKSKILTAP